MKRRTWQVFAWSCAWLAASSQFGQPSTAAELRGRSGTRSPYRLAALQDDEFQESMPADEPSLEEAPAEEFREGEAPSAETPADSAGTAPPSARPQPRRSAPPVHPRSMLPPAESAWDADVISTYDPADGSCSDGTCGAPYGDDGGFGCYGSWGSLEYVLWWRDKRNTPVLVTTTTSVAGQDVDAQLGQPDTRVLLGNDQFDDHLQPGGRFDLGMWVDPCKTTGIGLRYTGLAGDEFSYTTNSDTHPVLAVPFFNLDPAVDGQDTLLVAHPLDFTTGSITVTGRNETHLGDVYLRVGGARSGSYRIDVLGGYFFSSINEDLTLQSSTLSAGTEISVRDRFRTKNHYQGGSIGLQGEFDRGPWKVNVLAKVALANVEQTSIIDGLTRVGGSTQSLTGLFAQDSNRGTLERDEFAVVPELGLNWAYRIGCGAELTMGYSLVYWSETIRPGDQMNRRIDPSQTTAAPAQRLVSSDYWAQGVNFGLSWQY
jgi:hypothetical protein